MYNYVPGKKFAFWLLKKFWQPPEKIYKHLHFKGIFKVAIDKHNTFLLRHYGFQIENEIFWTGLHHAWEKTSMALWIQLCRSSRFIFDVGANTGVYALVAQCVNTQASVHAFEPVTRVYAKLVENCKLNHFDIHCSEQALSNEDGIATIYDTENEHTLSVTVNRNTLNPAQAARATRIGICKLSTYMENNSVGGIDLIKIDVETHEPEVLEGLGPYLDKFRPTLLIEVLTDEIGERIEAHVRGKNYWYFNINESGRVSRTESIRKSEGNNYLICQQAIAHRLVWDNLHT